MNRLIKEAALILLPPLRRIVAHRDQLLRQVEAAALEERVQWRKHRPYRTLNAEPAIGTGSSVDDRRIVERLLKAYQRSSPGQYGSDSVWRTFFETYHKGPHEVFMRGDVEQARVILANPGTNDMFYGFDELCSTFLPMHIRTPHILSNLCQDNLIRLSEALGVFRLDNAETEQWLTNAATPTDEVIRGIEAALGREIYFPNIYYGTVGARSYRGIVTYRAVQALYVAFRVAQIIQDSLHNNAQRCVCEIGAGLGRSAFYANLLGLKDYTLVDVPMTTISQGYYLMRCLGEDAVALPGEARHSREQIRLMHSEDFFVSEERFDLIANVDSLTELGHDLAVRYLRKISAITPTFLSINHEVNPIRVVDLLKELETPHRLSRHPYWMRQGYTEELVRFQP